MPALASAKARALGIGCLNNMRQLQLSSIVYAGDNSDTIATADNIVTTQQAEIDEMTKMLGG